MSKIITHCQVLLHPHISEQQAAYVYPNASENDDDARNAAVHGDHVEAALGTMDLLEHLSAVSKPLNVCSHQKSLLAITIQHEFLTLSY